MLKFKMLCLAMVVCLLNAPIGSFAKEGRYAETLCNQSDYHCIKVKKGQSWERLFPNPEQRDIVKRVNRMNTGLWAGLVIAVPNNLEQLTIYDVAPFPRYIDPTGEKSIYVSQKNLAWAAYNSDGELVWWGPISSGKSYCADVGKSCSTPGGSYRIIRKQGLDCVSTVFPQRRYGPDGGAPMPYCMHFYRGYALHGSPIVPGRRDSHGCVRLFIEDAKWLNQEFIDVPGKGKKGTKVIIESI